MVKCLIAFFLGLICVLVCAQTVTRTPAYRGAAAQRGAAAAVSFSPTNMVGVTNLSWWVAQGQMNTNVLGLLSNWLDAGVSPKNLTNGNVVSTTWPRMTNGIINGLAAVHFHADDAVYLRNLSYTSSQPHEVTMVVRFPDPPNNNYHTLFDSTGAGNQNAFFLKDNNVLASYSGSFAGNITYITNKWVVLSILYNGASSGLFTNNVSVGTISAGTQTADGLIVGIASDFTLRFNAQIAEILTYKTSLGAVDAVGVFSVATARSNVYWYFTNKYGAANFQ